MGAEDPSRTFPAEPPAMEHKEEEILRLLRQAATEVARAPGSSAATFATSCSAARTPTWTSWSKTARVSTWRRSPSSGARRTAVSSDRHRPGHAAGATWSSSSPPEPSLTPRLAKAGVRPRPSKRLRPPRLTVNTLLMDLDGQVHDPLGTGLADLEAAVAAHSRRSAADRSRTIPCACCGPSARRSARFELAPDLRAKCAGLRDRLGSPVVRRAGCRRMRKMLVSSARS